MTNRWAPVANASIAARITNHVWRIWEDAAAASRRNPAVSASSGLSRGNAPFRWYPLTAALRASVARRHADADAESSLRRLSSTRPYTSCAVPMGQHWSSPPSTAARRTKRRTSCTA